MMIIIITSSRLIVFFVKLLLIGVCNVGRIPSYISITQICFAAC